LPLSDVDEIDDLLAVDGMGKANAKIFVRVNVRRTVADAR